MLCSLVGESQNNCEMSPMTDTIITSKKERFFTGEFIQTTLKNNSVVQFYKLNNNKCYLKLIVTVNLYFGRADHLEILSGTKSYHEKNIEQFEIDKSQGYFVLEVFKNYLVTLKEEGITGLIFGKAETEFTKQDARQIKHIARCFYDNVTSTK
jgi:hypothetical protein